MVARMLGNKTIAEDAIQDIMIKLWKRRKELDKHPNIPGFVFLTAKNYCMDELRKKTPSMDSDELLLQTIPASPQRHEVEWNELNAIIKSLLKKLPEQQREVMMMRDLDGLEFSEIAAATQLKVEHIRVLLSRARKQIATYLKIVYSYE